MDDAMAVQVNHGQHALDGHVDDVLRQQRRAQFGGRGAGADLRLRIDSARPAVDQKSTRVINKKVSWKKCFFFQGNGQDKGSKQNINSLLKKMNEILADSS